MRKILLSLSLLAFSGGTAGAAQETPAEQQAQVDTSDVPAATLDVPAEASAEAVEKAADAAAGAVDAIGPLQELRESATKLAAAIDTAITEGKDPPLHTDLADSLLIYDAFNRDVLRTLPDDLAVVKETCTPVMAAGVGYGRWLISKRDGADAAAAKIQDELALAFAAEDLCSKRTLALTAASLEGLNQQEREAMAGTVTPMRTGALRIEIGMLRAQTDKDVSAANRALLLGALLDSPETLAASLTPEQRDTLVQTIDTVAAKVEPGVADQLAQLKPHFTISACSGLCAFHAAPAAKPAPTPAPVVVTPAPKLAPKPGTKRLEPGR